MPQNQQTGDETESSDDGEDTDWTRVNPKVDEQILDDLKVAIQAFNDGKLRGRLGPVIDEAMQIYLVSLYARNPNILQDIEKHVDPAEVEELDDPEEYQERILRYQRQALQTIRRTARELELTETGGKTQFEQYLMPNPTDKPDDVEPDRSEREQTREKYLKERLVRPEGAGL